MTTPRPLAVADLELGLADLDLQTSNLSPAKHARLQAIGRVPLEKPAVQWGPDQPERIEAAVREMRRKHGKQALVTVCLWLERSPGVTHFGKGCPLAAVADRIEQLDAEQAVDNGLRSTSPRVFGPQEFPGDARPLYIIPRLNAQGFIIGIQQMVMSDGSLAF